MNRFEYAQPDLAPEETKLISANNVRLYDGDTKTSYGGGEVVLTSHRIWWAKLDDSFGRSICLSLSLKYVVFMEEEIPSAFQFTRSSKVVLHLSQPHASKGPGPMEVSCSNSIKLSFKEGLDPTFVSLLNHALQQKKWETFTMTSSVKQVGIIKPRTGIVGIERGIQERQKATDQSISAAFQDLSRLMETAKDMVVIAKTISTKISERQGSITEDETVRFKSYLLSLGIDDPVSREMYSSETHYMRDLVTQLTQILEGPIKEQGGMMSLVDAYCFVNRARGLDLLSPEDLLRAARLLDHPLKLRKFDSGVQVLQLSSHSDEVVVQSTRELLDERGSLSAEELSQKIGISVLLAKEQLLTTEKCGLACRDESIEGLRFYPNLLLEKHEDNN